MKTVAIVLAAGSGKRMGTAIKKQYMDIAGKPVLYYSLLAFNDSEIIDEIVLVVSKEDYENVKEEYGSGQFAKLHHIVEGGKERYNSVYNGIAAAEGADYIFIHDGARPFVSNDIISRCYEGVTKFKACVAAVPSKDTVKICNNDGYVETTPNRSNVWIIQTPQCFEYNLIRRAYTCLINEEQNDSLGNIQITDDAMVAEHYTDIKVKMVTGAYNNIKITTPEDIPVAETLMKLRALEVCK